MKFRDYEVDEIRIVENSDYFQFQINLTDIFNNYIIIDAQYSTRVDWYQGNNGGYPATDSQGNVIYYPTTIYSVLLMLRKKE